MTPEEQNMLAELANKIAQTPAPPKDPDAEDFIRRNIGSRPDALYLMTQTVLIQNMAIQRAQQQIQELQQRAGQSAPMGPGAGPSSFLGQQTTGQPGAPRGYSAPPPSYAAPQYAAPPPQYAPQYAAPAAGAPSGPGSFLRSAATTAAGVAAGALAFEGIESLFSHHGGGGFGGFGGGSGLMGGQPVEETVINNYYDDPRSGGSERGGQFADTSDLADTGNLSDVQDTDLQDDVQDNAQTEDVDYDDSNTSDDNSGSDDNFA